jgi:preprotein translocase subunit SecD
LIHRALLLLLTSAAPALADVPLLTIAFPGETVTVPQGTPVRAETTVDMNGQPAVYLRLPEPQATTFAKTTERHVGQIIGITVCGDLLSQPLLQTPIPSGAMVLTGAPTAQAATQIAARLTTGRCDAP